MKQRRRAGVTLIELLIVIGVIGILMGILLPAFVKARNTARLRQIDSDCKALETAVRGFRHEYGYWPCPDSSAGGVFVTNNNQVMEMLVVDPVNPASSTNNFRRIAFWETTNAVVDPNGYPYRITIDVTNNSVTVTPSM